MKWAAGILCVIIIIITDLHLSGQDFPCWSVMYSINYWERSTALNRTLIMRGSFISLAHAQTSSEAGK